MFRLDFIISADWTQASRSILDFFARLGYSAFMANFYKDKKVLITGAAGFIGSFLVQRLVVAGARVSAALRIGSNPWRLKEIKNQIKVVECDLSDAISTRNTISAAEPEILFNLASRVDRTQSVEVLDELIQHNFLITKNVLDAAHKIGVQRFIQIGTIEEYGSQEAPFVETQQERPISPYSLSKVMATKLTLLFSRLFGFNACVVRPAATFGPKQGFTMLTPVVIRACLQEEDFYMNLGEQLKDLLFVEDLVDGLMMVGMSDSVNGEIINLGSNKQYLIKDVVNSINSLMGKPITVHFGARPYRPQDPMEFYLNSDKAERLLGWRAKTDLDSALAKTIEWYKNERIS